MLEDPSNFPGRYKPEIHYFLEFLNLHSLAVRDVRGRLGYKPFFFTLAYEHLLITILQPLYLFLILHILT